MNQIKEIILQTQKDNKISCIDALEIANEHNVPPATVGGICNELHIKIKGCQLGCF